MQLLTKKGFNAFAINSENVRDQREAENQALLMRKQDLTKNVLTHWINVGNYWIDKKHKITKTEVSDTKYHNEPEMNNEKSNSSISPPRPFNMSNAFEDTANKTELKQTNNFEYSFKKDKNSPRNGNVYTSAKKNSPIKSQTAEKMERIKQLLSSVNKPSVQVDHSYIEESKLKEPTHKPEEYSHGQPDASEKSSEQQLKSHEVGSRDLKAIEEAKNIKKQEILYKISTLRTQIQNYQYCQQELSHLEAQYTHTGNENILPRARQLCMFLRAEGPKMQGYTSEVTQLTMHLNS